MNIIVFLSLCIFVFLLIVTLPVIIVAWPTIRKIRFKFWLANLISTIFNKNNSIPNAAATDRAKEAIIALEYRKLPAFVHQRIAEQNQGNLPWVSNLSVSDWLLLKQYKFRSLGAVMGAAHYHLAFSEKNYINKQKYSAFSYDRQSKQLVAITEGIRETFDLAMSRLQEEAKLLGAHAVVNIQIKANLPAKGSHQVEYVLFGTAIELDDVSKPEKPVLSAASVIDFVKLMQAGSMPVGLGIGIGIYYDASSYSEEIQSRSWSNQEIRGYSDAVNAVRQLAVRGLQADINKYQGNGVLASAASFQIEKIEVERGDHDKREDHILQYVCLGTILSNQNRHNLPKFQLALDLTQ